VSLTWRDIVVLIALVVIAVDLGALAEVLPKHLRWKKENRRHD
jgi:hypothetical protein